MYAMTAAHPTLPIPSYVRVRHLRSGATVIVRVNDRGPFKPDRVIDLSYAAAVRLGYAAAGTAEVEVVRLTHADIRGGRVSAAEMFLAVDVERIGIAADIAGGQRRAPGSDE
jgi:rare lipoprotein A